MRLPAIDEKTFDIGGEAFRLELYPDESAPNPRKDRTTFGVLCLPGEDHLSDPTAPTVPEGTPDRFWEKLGQRAAGRKYHAEEKKIELDIEQRTLDAMNGEDGPDWDATSRLEAEKQERIRDMAENLALEHFCVLNVYKYEHGNVAYNTEGFASSWDSGQVGWIYAAKDHARAKLFTGDEDPNDSQVREKARGAMASEIEIFSTWAAGNVVGYKLIDADGHEAETCWGFYDWDYAVEDAKRRAEALVT